MAEISPVAPASADAPLTVQPDAPDVGRTLTSTDSSKSIARGPVARLVEALMRAFPAAPSYTAPTLRERLNRHDFTNGSLTDRRAILMELAHSRYLSERELPVHRLFGLNQEQMTRALRGGKVLELGCFVGGSTVAQAEAYDVGEMWGLDIEDVFLEGAKLYGAGKRGKFQFVKGYGESIPLPSNEFDAIVTQDTIEHVVDVRATLRESARILKPSGLMFCVFPSFYHPWGNHVTMATVLPWLHLFFDDDHIETAYRSIIARRGDDAYWYRPGNAMQIRRGRFHGVNGITAAKFRRLARLEQLEIVKRHVVPLFGLGRRVERHPWLKLIGGLTRVFATVPVLEEVLLHRVCYVLQKPPVTRQLNRHRGFLSRNM